MAEQGEDKLLKALCKLFIGGLPRTVTDEELCEYFLQFNTQGESLNDCIVIKDQERNSRGFGFVTYNSLADADNCLANGPHTISGKDVEVKHAIPRDDKVDSNHQRTNKVFVGGLSKEATEEDITEAIENHVLECGELLNAKVTKVDIIKTKEDDPPVSRGFAFLDMAADEDADKVVIVKHFDIAGKQVELKKAEPKGGSGGGRGGRGGGRGRGGGGGGGGGGRSGGQFGGGGGMGGWGSGGGAYNGSPYSTAGQFGYDGYGGYGGGYGGYGGGGGMFGQYAQQTSGFGPSRGRSRGRGRGNPY